MGEGAWIDLQEGARYRLSDGTCGKMRVVGPVSHLRFTWQPEGWIRPSKMQSRNPKADRRVVAFQQEKLPGSEGRELRRMFFWEALEMLERWIETR